MREVKVKKYKGSFLLKFAIFCFACFFIFSMVNQQMQITEKETQLEEVRSELEDQTIRNEALEEALDEDVDMDTYVEAYARKEYHYARPDERVFINIGGQEAEE